MVSAWPAYIVSINAGVVNGRVVAHTLGMGINRRQMMGLGAAAYAAVATGGFAAAESHKRRGSGKYAPVFAKLDRFVEDYMREMHAPGMTLVLADRDGVQRVVTYGFGDREQRRPVQREELFQIGSISKSFLALSLLQMRDEGKLDLHKPIVEYLPWFRVESRFAPITAHHLLTHGSGLPGASEVFLSDPALKHRAAFAPGEHFYYNNMAFTLLGHLAWTLDGQELPVILRQRIFGPLGMDYTEPAITLDMRDRLVKSYSAFRDDRPDGADSQLCEAPAIIMTSGAGCIASSAEDMGVYVQMLASSGAGPKGPLVSKDSFGLFSTAHIKAAEFGPTAAYGYGIAVDTLDGHRVIRHTGGMVSFASSICVDLDAGVGAFASINAMQQYRPTPVTQFAAQLMRALNSGDAVTTVASPPPAKALDLQPYVGHFIDQAGRELLVAAGAGGLTVERGGKPALLQPSSETDHFYMPNSPTEHFSLVFGRSDPSDPNSPVVEAGWGEQWYTNSRYTGPRAFDVPSEWHTYVGHYRNDSPWIGSMRIVLRRGQLWLNGETPLAADGERFRLIDADPNPEWLQFKDPVNNRCMRLVYSGVDLWRVAVA